VTKYGNRQKLQAIKIAMDQIEKQFGRGSIMKLGEKADKFSVEVIPSGSIAIDIALGIGGFPREELLKSTAGSIRKDNHCSALHRRGAKGRWNGRFY